MAQVLLQEGMVMPHRHRPMPPFVVLTNLVRRQPPLTLGINFFDTAPYYSSATTKSEDVLGIALQELKVPSPPKSFPDPEAPRDTFHVNTKVGRYRDAPFDYSDARMEVSVKESLQRLRLDYVDMITVHDIEFSGY